MPNPPLFPPFPSPSLYNSSLPAKLINQMRRTTLHLLRSTAASLPRPAEAAEQREARDDGEAEAPSLRHFAVMTRLHVDSAEPRASHGRGLPREPRRPPSQPDLFEFVHAIGSEMCAAEDVFLRGQLLPYKPPPPSPAHIPAPTPQPRRVAVHTREHKRCPSSQQETPPARHSRSESLDGYERSRAGGDAATRYRKGKGSHSADYQRLRLVTEECETKAVRRAGATSPRPKWYVLVFGSVRVPVEMDIKEIRSRLRRRSNTSPSAVAGGDNGNRADSMGGVGKAGGGGGTWKLLRSLSCKGDVGGVVDGSLSFVV